MFLHCFSGSDADNVIRVAGVPEHFNLPWQLAEEVSMTMEWHTQY